MTDTRVPLQAPRMRDHCARKRDAEESRIADLEARISSGRFRFKITVDEVHKWAVFDRATWDFMGREVIIAIQRSRSWSIEDLTH